MSQGLSDSVGIVPEEAREPACHRTDDAGDDEEEEEEDEEGEDDSVDEGVSLPLHMSKTFVKVRVKELIQRFLKGFGSGLGVYTGIQVVTALMRNPFRESLPKIKTSLLAKDSIRFAFHLGIFPSLYDLAVEVLESYRGKRDDWNSAMAGGLAGLSIVIEDPTRRRIYCLFAIARAIGAFVSTLVKRNVIPAIPYSETALFCWCTSFLVYCTALKPQYLFTGYYRSVLKWSRDYTDVKLKRLFREPGSVFLSCNEAGLHPDSCAKHAIRDFMKSLPPFAKLYLPIHLAPIIFFKHKRLLRKPKQTVIGVIKNIFWSTAFLGTMVMLAKYVICLLRNLRHKPPPLDQWIPAMAGLAAGLGVLFERVNRRKELSLFLIPHTLSAVYLWTKELGIIPHVRNSSVLLYSMAMVPIMHAYEREPESLSLLLHSALKFFVGKRKSTVERKRLRQYSEVSVSEA